MRIALALVLVALATACADVQCKLNSDCANMEHCSAQNTCVTECRAQRDCLVGQTCTINGVCISSTADGATSVDAGEADAGELDVSIVDTEMDVHIAQGTDAGVDIGMDAPIDTGTVDTGVDVPIDIRPLDAGIDVPIDNGPPDTGIDVSVDSGPIDTGVDVPRPDVPTDTGALADAGPVGVGVYSFTGVEAPAGMVDPVAVVWHPSGSYALILGVTNNVYRYTAATHAVVSVATTSASLGWRMGAFTHDGTTALLIGSTYSSSTSSYTGHLYTWTDATSTLMEQTAEQWTSGSYQSIRFAWDGSQAALLGQGNPMTSQTIIWYVSTAGHRTSVAAARGMVMSEGCNDLAWTVDGFGNPEIDMVCADNTGEVDDITNLGSGSPMFTSIMPGNTGNVGAIAGTLGGSIELAVSFAAQRIYRKRSGVWDIGFDTPMIDYADGVSFNDNGTRAFAFGGPGYLYEYRTDDFTLAGITSQQIPITGTPWFLTGSASVNDAQWRPGCDEGLAVGGTDTFSGTSSFIAYFAAMNGRMCH